MAEHDPRGDALNDHTALLVRMPRDLHAALKEQAAAEDRTMSAVIRRAVREHLENADG